MSTVQCRQLSINVYKTMLTLISIVGPYEFHNGSKYAGIISIVKTTTDLHILECPTSSSFLWAGLLQICKFQLHLDLSSNAELGRNTAR